MANGDEKCGACALELQHVSANELHLRLDRGHMAAHTRHMTTERSPYRVPLATLEASAHVADEDQVEEQDGSPARPVYVNNEDNHIHGYPRLQG